MLCLATVCILSSRIRVVARTFGGLTSGRLMVLGASANTHTSLTASLRRKHVQLPFQSIYLPLQKAYTPTINQVGYPHRSWSTQVLFTHCVSLARENKQSIRFDILTEADQQESIVTYLASLATTKNNPSRTNQVRYPHLS